VELMIPRKHIETLHWTNGPSSPAAAAGEIEYFEEP
jgi:hypothetical protein